jgi:hypothetical protein
MSKKNRTRERPQNLVGKVLVGMYPRHNFQGVPSYCERRQVLVEKVRVLRREPLDMITPTINPLLNRGKVLITGTDLDKQEQRSFYLESFRVWESFDYEPEQAPPPAAAAETAPTRLCPTTLNPATLNPATLNPATLNPATLNQVTLNQVRTGLAGVGRAGGRPAKRGPAASADPAKRLPPRRRGA